MPSVPKVARIKPPALRPGDTVGIVAPASNVKAEHLEAGCAALRELGYKPFYFDSILERDLYFAGSADRRARELEEMFSRDEVRAIICARGGYGSNYLLDILDLNKIKAHPKIFVGYSDLTTLLTYFTDAAGLVTFHGPMAGEGFCARRRRRSGFLGMRAEWIVGVGAGAQCRGEIAGRGLCGRNSLRRMPLHSGGIFGHAL